MKLNARQVDTAKPKDKPYKLSDGGGLYLLVNPTGARYWRLKYRVAGKEKLLAVGGYPDVSLADARAKRDEAKRLLAAGGDPGEEKKTERQAKKVSVENTFEALAREWHAYKEPKWSKGYAEDLMESFEKDIFPYIGRRPVADIKPLEVLEALRKLEKRGVLDKMRKIRQACGQTFRYAIVTGRAENNPASELAGALAIQKHKHYPHLVASEFPEFLQCLNDYTGSSVTKIATRLLLLTGVRTIELRAAEWAEFDLDKGLWEVPKSRMKMRRPHLVPLSEQVLALLHQLQEITGRFKLVFPGSKSARLVTLPAKTMSIFRACPVR
nr:integrase arm-type DNA-binding domain-containing protein [Serratia sp. PAMC26656]